MVTLTKYGAKYNRNILFLEGLSTDTKPTDEFDGLSIQNGSEYTEVDTGKKFLFDYDNATWYEVQTGGGGGGGGTSNYNDLSNRPSVNNTVLTGNKTSAQLGLASSEQGGKADSAIQGVKLNSGSVITPDANNIVDIIVGKADVGLGNVTNDAQVKKISSSTSGDIVTWGGTSGDTVADSGVSIETSITDSNLKIPTSKAVNTALGDKVDKVSGKGLSTNDYTTTEKTKLAGIAEGAEVNVQSNWTQTTTTADDYIKNKPTLGTAAAKNATDTYNATGNDVTTGKAVAAALATLPEPMVFKGSLGTGGTITTLPTASSSNKGYVYKVITAGTYASQSAKVGDTFISDGSVWVLIPSGDEPSGTVTNVAVANGGGLTVSGSPITSSGTITVGHSNSVTAKTSSSVKKFTYDANGHVTGSSELSTAESNALASGIDSTKVAQINTNQTNIGKVQTQANWNTNNGVKNLATINNFSHTGYNKDVPVDGSLTGNVTVYIGNIISTDTDANQCAVLFIYTDDTSSPIHLVNRGTASSFSANLEAKVLKSVRIYSSDNYVHSSGDTVTVTNLMVCPKSLYDADSTYEPYALPNTKITPELIELVDSGAKNELELVTPYGSGLTNNPNLTVTLNSDQTITVNGSVTTSGAIVISNTISGKLGKYLSGRPAGVTADIRLTAYSQPSWSTAGNDYNGKGATITDNGNILITIYVIAGQTYSNLTFKPMICSKAAWDVSQKFVPYRPTYEETVEQVAENKNNISSLQITEIAITVESAIDDLPMGTVTSSPAVSIAGYSANTWLVIHTYDLNSGGTRRMQVIEATDNTRKTRFKGSGGWGNWA